ncbi:MAG: carbamoyltransferase [bacterium]|nr:carbamoyltransferase [bacterium]
MKQETKNPIYILGISCFYHDSAVVLIKDGQLIAAAQEERFTRKKHDDSFPAKAVEYCLKEAGITPANLSYVAFYDKPLLKFERIVTSFINSWPHGYKTWLRAMPVWLKEKLWTKVAISKNLPGYNGPIYFTEHHMSHAASSFFVSPFKEAAVLTVDGVGEWATTTWGVGKENKIELKKEIHFPESLGLFYSILTYYLGFKPNSAEYKVMGLAPYGHPKYVEVLRNLIKIYADGSFALNKKVFKGFYELGGFEKALARYFGFEKRKPEDPLEQKHKDLAASLQFITNEAMVTMAKHIQKETGLENLCMAGGVALNCVASSEVLKKSGFKNIFIQPAAGDAGGALGAAYYIWHQVLGNSRDFVQKHCFYGPEFGDEQIKIMLDKKEVVAEHLADEWLFNRVAQLIADQKVIGWFQGRMEWGPRSLGARSILADARNKGNWQRVNLKIKFRESFRPFAPSVLEEDSLEYFDFVEPAPYMLFTAKVKKDDVPAVTHVDKTARLQTVNQETNPRYHRLISEFKKITGCPVIINTSFNVRGEPIVCTPEDAFNTFIKTDLDFLVLGNYLLDKKEVIKKYPFVPPQISSSAD